MLDIMNNMHPAEETLAERQPCICLSDCVMMLDVVNTMHPTEGMPAERQALCLMPTPEMNLVSKTHLLARAALAEQNQQTLHTRIQQKATAYMLLGGSASSASATPRCLTPVCQAATIRCPNKSSSHGLGCLPKPEANYYCTIISHNSLECHHHGPKEVVHSSLIFPA